MVKRAKLLWIMIYYNREQIPQDFGEYSMLISNLFSYIQTPVILPRTSRFNLEFSPEPEELWIIPDNLGESSYTVRATFPFDEFFKGDDLQKKHLLAKETYNCLVPLYQKLGLNVEALRLNYNKIITDNFKLTRIIAGGKKFNKNRTIKALVTAEYFLGYCLITISFYDRIDKLVYKRELFKCLPTSFFYSWIIKTLSWVDNHTIKLTNSTGEFFLNITIDGVVSADYNPKRRDEDGVKEEVRYITTELFIEI